MSVSLIERPGLTQTTRPWDIKAVEEISTEIDITSKCSCKELTVTILSGLLSGRISENNIYYRRP